MESVRGKKKNKHTRNGKKCHTIVCEVTHGFYCRDDAISLTGISLINNELNVCIRIEMNHATIIGNICLIYLTDYLKYHRNSHVACHQNMTFSCTHEKKTFMCY